ncbi:T9SS type A sorting domain-containing protein [Flammeovirga yaeyamensis]|uniref:T9SS type A sorting domain-containing protein n=1 Tax=Flammeovirga yaeyamensis TaxID=367791 RepID=A0AAX1N326_9BACT|nr:PKD domain-containing protein [Flammeovirga yaeyamensis]MBB3701510.1 hypothetical protein [Flammeovirga yaeyamensis]NMF38675.1 T9SS type A sorting domain-containing protein [Flammeovirga yaeyamensis]QWG01830.1 T9SS type A sorting domain-containing protein [Flammeovirga yaeyamensis]
MKNYFIALLLSLFTPSLIAQTTLEGTYTIGADGDFATLKEAADTLNTYEFSNDVTLLIHEGVYTDSFILDSLQTNGYGLCIKSSGEGENTILIPKKSEDDYLTGIYLRGIDGLSISNLTIKNDSINQVKLTQTHLVENTLSIDSCSNIHIQHLSMTSDTIGTEEPTMFFATSNLRLRLVHDVLIDSSYFSGAMYNITSVLKDSSTNIEVRDNVFENSYYDVRFAYQRGKGYKVYNNDFLTRRRFGSGCHLQIVGETDSYPDSDTYTGDISIKHNYFNGIGSEGNTKCIYLQYIQDAEVEQNEMIGGYYGMFILYGDSVILNRNKITTTVYTGIECGAIHNYFITNNTFICHNSAYAIYDQYTYDKLIIANNTFYRQEVPTHDYSYTLRIRDFEGDSLAIVNNLFSAQDTVAGFMYLEYFEKDLSSPNYLIDYNGYVMNSSNVEAKSMMRLRRVNIKGETDGDTTIVSFNDWQNFLPNIAQHSFLFDTDIFEELPIASTDGDTFVQTADFHLNNGFDFRKGLFIDRIKTDIDGDPRTAASGLDVGSDQYHLATDIAFETCDEDITFETSNATDKIISYSWDFGDGTTSSEINPAHTYEELGEYTITLKYCDADTYCDSTTFKVSITDEGCKFVESPTSIELNNSSIVIYPNPSKGNIQISSSMLLDDVDVQLIDLSGTVLYREEGHLHFLSADISKVLSQLENGMYIIKVDDGENQFSKKIILGK